MAYVKAGGVVGSRVRLLDALLSGQWGWLGVQDSDLCPDPLRRVSFKGAPSEEQVREASLGLLTGYLGPLMDAMVESAGHCPLAMRLVFKKLQQCVETRFPQEEHKVGWTCPLGGGDGPA